MLSLDVERFVFVVQHPWAGGSQCKDPRTQDNGVLFFRRLWFLARRGVDVFCVPVNRLVLLLLSLPRTPHHVRSMANEPAALPLGIPVPK